MKRILLIKSSLFNGASTSNQLGEELVGEIMANNPGSTLATLDLAASPIAHLDGEEFASWTVDPGERNLDQQRRLEFPTGLSSNFLLTTRWYFRFQCTTWVFRPRSKHG